ncbi:MAG: polysaccharide deacetylase family protein [Bacteroidota bacterium]
MRYIVEWFQEHHLHEAIELTDSVADFRSYTGARINYSAQRITDKECWIEPHSILFGEEIHAIPITVSTNGSFPIFFCGRGDMGFDLLGASFYLIVRYEEYLSFKRDMYGRYAHEQSIAFEHGFLHRPIVDEWMKQFMLCLRSYFPELLTKSNQFRHLATYDIDESYAYQYKPVWKQLGGVLRDLFYGRFDWITERVRTLLRLQQDPYDSFSRLEQLHVSIGDRPICFIHAGEKNGRYDKNFSPRYPEQQRLIRSLEAWSDLGLHPSWQTGDQDRLLSEEKKSLEAVINRPVHLSRQHYIRFHLPTTYHQLIDAGITDDYSMGYGSVNGFRAGTSRSFQWFDLSRNINTSLRIHPFCYMEANSYFELNQSVDEAEIEWRELEKVIRSVNGQMITIWHNIFLGSQKRFVGWGDRYVQWLMTLTR